MTAHWINPQGYELVKVDTCRVLFRDVAIYRVLLDPEKPLTYIDKHGVKYQPGKEYDTDMGTIPFLLQRIVSKDEYLLSFLLHDWNCMMGYVWACSPDVDGPWDRMPMPRKDADEMLKETVLVEGTQLNKTKAKRVRWQARWIYRGVRVGAWFSRKRKVNLGG